jgi:hypothetical protein
VTHDPVPQTVETAEGGEEDDESEQNEFNRDGFWEQGTMEPGSVRFRGGYHVAPFVGTGERKLYPKGAKAASEKFLYFV